MDVLSTTHHTDPPAGPLRGLGSVLGGIGGELADPQWWRNPASSLAALERAADRDPTDRRLAAAVTWAVDRIALDATTPQRLGGVVRQRLIRWDAHTAVWVGTDAGVHHMVRALRPSAAADPAWHRAMRREARALQAVSEVELVEEPEVGPVLRVPLAGRPLAECTLDARDLARPLLTGLAALVRWERAGLGLPAPAADELRLDRAGISLCCLWPVQGTVQPALTALATLLLRAARDRGDDEPEPGPTALRARAIARDALLARIRALSEHDSTAVDAGRLARQALAEGLAARRHALAAAWRDALHRSRSARLLDAVARLQAAVPAPAGRGAVGVDLDGDLTGVVSDGSTVRWGPWRVVSAPAPAGDGDGDGGGGDDTVVYDPVHGFRPAVARRLLRTRAVCPPSAALDARIGGSASRTDAICRWVAAGLQLRTVQLLLQRELG